MEARIERSDDGAEVCVVLSMTPAEYKRFRKYAPVEVLMALNAAEALEDYEANAFHEPCAMSAAKYESETTTDDGR